MSFGDSDHDPDDMFVHTKMSFWDHIEELRMHLWKAIIGFVAALVIGLFIGQYAVEFIARPVEVQLNKFYERRVKSVEEKLQAGNDAKLNEINMHKEVEMRFKRGQLAQAFGLPEPAGASEFVDVEVQIRPLKLAGVLATAQREIGRRPALSTLSVTEAFIVYFKVSIYCGLILAAPWIFYQIWSFVAAGLYTHEKKLIHVYLPVSIFLFLAGVMLCQFFVIPVAIDYLLSFNEWMNLEPDLRLNEWLSFAIMMPLIFGAAFQLPLVMLFLYRLGVVDVPLYRKHRRIAMFLMACLAVVLSASPDVFSMMSLTVPLWVLYEFGILMCVWSPRPAEEVDEPDPEEMVEV
ncbi:MAG: twin-arginine translocase subunit TatC [Gemmataceae bacterium]|nr:twin-arginine translocase subunit TatC [Gemmataceae bacterium]